MAERLLGVFSPASAVRYALASAVGLVTGVLLFAWWTHSISGSGVGDADISGTMLSNESLNALPIGTRLEVQRDLVQGWVATGQSGDISLLRMDLSAEEPIRAVVWFPSQDVGIAGTRLHEPLDGSMTLGNGEVTVVAKGHSSATLFFFRRVSEPTRVRITIASAGAIIYERELTLGE